MKKTLIATVAAMAMFSTTAMAEDYDNTAVKLTAQTDTYSVSVKSPKTGATEFAAKSTVGPVDLEAKWSRNGAVDNYALKVDKQIEVPATPFYVGGEAEFKFGDSYTSNTRELIAMPYVGIASTFDKLTPYAEVGYSIKSTTNDITDFARNESEIKVGARYALDTNVDLSVQVKETRDVDFKNPGDRQAEVGLTFKF